MSQTTYARELSSAVPGLVSRSMEALTVSYPAGEAITPGRAVILSAGKVYHPQAAALANPAGFACFSPTNQQTAIPAAGFTYAIGDMVPVLRRGRMYVSLQGGTPAAFSPANMNHSSTVATHRGKVSASVTTGVAGSEISQAGPVMFVEAGPSGVWLVEVDYFANGLGNAPTVPAPLSLPAFAAGDTAPASIVHMGVYDVPATAANSTISLPVAAPDGTVCFIHADGTKNGHTLTVRDVATAISAASTASKRVAVTAMKADGKWVCTMTVGP